LESAWTEILTVSDHKKGATKYSTPDFTVGKLFTTKEIEVANEKYTDIANYFNKYTKEVDVVEPEVEEENVDLPF